MVGVSLSELICYIFVFFFKQKTAYEMRISDWSSDVCSSDLGHVPVEVVGLQVKRVGVGQEHRQALRDLLAIGRAQPDIDGRAAVARGGRSCGCRLGGFALLARRLGHLLSPGKAMTPQWGLEAGPVETESCCQFMTCKIGKEHV